MGCTYLLHRPAANAGVGLRLEAARLLDAFALAAPVSTAQALLTCLDACRQVLFTLRDVIFGSARAPVPARTPVHHHPVDLQGESCNKSARTEVRACARVSTLQLQIDLHHLVPDDELHNSNSTAHGVQEGEAAPEELEVALIEALCTAVAAGAADCAAEAMQLLGVNGGLMQTHNTRPQVLLPILEQLEKLFLSAACPPGARQLLHGMSLAPGHLRCPVGGQPAWNRLAGTLHVFFNHAIPNPAATEQR